MITRAWQMSELREVGEDEKGRVISGRAIPYDSPTEIYENGRLFTERVKMGAFSEAVKLRGDRTPFLGFHDARSFPLGRTLSLNEKDAGLYFEARISDTTDGNDALTLVRDGAIDGVSVGMSIPNGGDAWSDDHSERQINRAFLHEMSLVNFPAYDKARVEAIREAREPTGEGEPIFSDTSLTITNFATGTTGGILRLTPQPVEETPDPMVKVRLEALRFRWNGKRIQGLT